MRLLAGQVLLGICIAGIVMGTPDTAAADKIAVLDVKVEGIDQALVSTLTEVLTAEIEAHANTQVIAGRDVEAMLGFEKEKDLVGCTDTACLAEIGGALGADKILVSQVGMVGDTYVINLKLINIRRARTDKRVYETVRGKIDVLIEGLRRSAARLYASETESDEEAAPAAAVPKPAQEKKNQAATPAKAATPSPSQTAQTHSKEGSSGPLWLMGTGGGALAVGAIFGFRARSKASDTDVNHNTEVFGGELKDAVETGQRSQTIANVFLVSGVLLAGGGLAWWLLSGPPDDRTVALTPSFAPDGVGLAISGGF